ncbi:MAG: hypothetical protein V4633_23595 [Pseudomonadota bacterium]
MFSSTEHITRATRDVFDTQAAFYTASVQAIMDAGMAATELHVDALKSLLASTTVATRQWFTGDSGYNWLTPVLQHPGWRASPANASGTDAPRFP